MRLRFPSRRCASCLAVVLLTFFVAPVYFSQDAVPTEILNRTIYIRCVSEAGTAFKIDRQGKVYLVTARHIVAGVPVNGATIQVRTDG
jgi:hypothetical protein